MGKEVMPVFKLDQNKTKSCYSSSIDFSFVDFDNDAWRLNHNSVENWLELEIKSITIAEAVELNWRASFASCWETRATITMKDEYIAAIDKIIASMSESEKQVMLRVALMFKNK
jgi:hypothetical protein